MIVSHSPGRVRLRLSELKNKAIASLAASRLGDMPGITNVSANSATGSLLIEYDAKILPPEKLMEIGERELARMGLGHRLNIR